MANIYDVNNANIYSSSSTPGEPDEISVFLQQILLRSSSSSTLMQQQQSLAAQSDHTAAEKQKSVIAPVPSRIYAAEPPPVLKSSSGGCLAAAANVCSSSAGTFDNDLDEYDYESEEAAEAVVGEAAPKPTPPRSSSKRSRAAEVHNLSEKRRRSRINEKMKALQNLIPNSNKTDKASMLDEAIEYLKQLQLQVQMLTMRNGLSLYPICLPGMLQPNQSSPVRMNVSDRYKSLNMNIPKAISMDHQNTNTDAIADFSTMIGSKSSLELESSIQDQFGSFQFSKLSQGICEEKVLPCKQQNEDFSRVCLTGKGYCPELESSSSILVETQPSDAKKACLARGDCVLPNFVNNRNFSSQLDM